MVAANEKINVTGQEKRNKYEAHITEGVGEREDRRMSKNDNFFFSCKQFIEKAFCFQKPNLKLI